MVLFKALTSIGIWGKLTRLILRSIKFSCNCLDCILLRLRIVRYLNVGAVIIANFFIYQPALLDRDQKFAMVGGGEKYHDVKKSASLCLLSVCFLGVSKASKN
jgi:hypothetical protein